MKQERKEEIKLLLKDYLEKILNINTGKAFKCLNPIHEDKNPSMHFNNKNNTVHCFSCDVTYDIFDLIKIKYNVSGQEAFELAESICIEKLGLKPSGAKDIKKISEFLKDKELDQQPVDKKEETKMTIKEKYNKDSCNMNDVIKVNEYIKKCKEHLKETDYFTKRGISKEIQEKFYLGFDPGYKTSTGVWEGAVIRTSWTSYIVRNTDPASEKGNKVRKYGESFLFNFKHLTQKTDDYIFICEGEFDALSFETVGTCSIALGGVGNIEQLIELSKEYKPLKPFIIALDNDQVGKEATEKLIKGLRENKIPYYNADWLHEKYKDANEFLTSDKENFIKNIEKAKSKALVDGETYKQKSNLCYLQNFIDGITESANTPFVSTGFEKLDEVLDGGLYEGLYICGAISSLGKTTLITQIVDQVAEKGTDVLIFSLEMARTELMAKSISRNTLLKVMEEKKDISLAKTIRGITTGSRYAYYKNEEKEIITNAVRKYGEYADKIYIYEGIGNIGVKEIRKTVEDHIKDTGRRPIVVIDYIQILDPFDVRASDKQNIDHAVMELKRISRDLKISIIGISSFNRGSYSNTVGMESFKESGALEYGSDVLIGLQLKGAGTKDFNVDEAKQKSPREIELVILKNRNGATGKKVNFNYYAMFNYFKEV